MPEANCRTGPITSTRPYSPTESWHPRRPRGNFPIAPVQALGDDSPLSNSSRETPPYLDDPRHQFPEVLTPTRTLRDTQHRVARTGIKITARTVRDVVKYVVWCGGGWRLRYAIRGRFVICHGVLAATIGQIGTQQFPAMGRSGT